MKEFSISKGPVNNSLNGLEDSLLNDSSFYIYIYIGVYKKKKKRNDNEYVDINDSLVFIL